MAEIYGYYRCSTLEQDPALQISALKDAGCTTILGDHGHSGAKASRPALDEIMEKIGPGDKLVVWKLDRLGRSLRHLIDLNREIEARGASFESLTEKIDTSTAIGAFVYNILGSVAELEREMIRERTIAGMEAAAKRGRYPGRPRRVSKYRAGVISAFATACAG